MLSARTMGAALALMAVAATPASAAVVTYSGEDLISTLADPRPNSALAASNFAAATAGSSVIDFESAPVGNFTSLAITPNVTLTGTGTSINNTPNFPTDPTLDGFNTTSGGSQYAEILGSSLTFTFGTAVDAFGAYFMGLQLYFFQDTVTFSDGTSETLNIPMNGTQAGNGAISFLGFTDFGKSITSITITSGTNGGDFIGVDDVRYHSVAAAVPEPLTLSIFGAGVVGAAALRRRKAKKA